MIDEDR